MASFKIDWKRSALRDLKRITPAMVNRIILAVESLSNNPHPAGSRKLVGSDNTYRIREGDYRIVYDVMHEQIQIEVIRVAHRRDVYR